MDLNYTRDTTSGEEARSPPAHSYRGRIASGRRADGVGLGNVAVEAMRRGALGRSRGGTSGCSRSCTQAELGRAIPGGRQLEAANQALQADGRSPSSRSRRRCGRCSDCARRARRRQRADHRRERHRQRAWSLTLHAISPRPDAMVTVNAGGMAEACSNRALRTPEGRSPTPRPIASAASKLADGSALPRRIASVPMTQQQKLLRVIEHRRVRAARVVETRRSACD